MRSFDLGFCVAPIRLALHTEQALSALCSRRYSVLQVVAASPRTSGPFTLSFARCLAPADRVPDPPTVNHCLHLSAFARPACIHSCLRPGTVHVHMAQSVQYSLHGLFQISWSSAHFEDNNYWEPSETPQRRWASPHLR